MHIGKSSEIRNQYHSIKCEIIRDESNKQYDKVYILKTKTHSFGSSEKTQVNVMIQHVGGSSDPLLLRRQFSTN